MTKHVCAIARNEHNLGAANVGGNCLCGAFVVRSRPEPHDRFENDRESHPAWIVERRPCPFCSVLKCGCPNEPEPVLIPANIVLGGDGD